MAAERILEGKRVLVTGGTGFIGGRLVERLVLEQKAQVRVLVRNFSSASRIGRFDVEIIRGGIDDAEAVDRAMEGCDIVYHLAFDFAPPAEMIRRNVEGTHNVMIAALKHNTRLVHISTVDVYGWPEAGDLDETAPRQASDDNIYGQSKLAVEQAVVEFHQKWSLPVVILQPTIVYGPYCRPWTMGIAQKLKGDKPVALIDDGSAACNAVYVDDVVSAMLLAGVKDDAIGETFLISAAEPITWRAFYDEFEAITGTKNTVSVPSEEPAPPPPASAPAAPATPAASPTPQRPQLTGDIPFYTRWMLEKRVLIRIREAKGVGTAYRVVRWITPQGIWNLFKYRLGKVHRAQVVAPPKPGPGAPVTRSAPPPPPPVLMPPAAHMPMYRSQVRVKVDKAQQILGYEPQYTFEQGMEITAKYLEWANLT
jgi:nucleoside-diphosphate-sugar epimerase